MPPTSRIPPLLHPYTQLPPDQGCLTLLTGVLGASTNWLVIRYICGALVKDEASHGADEDTAVILVSWLRDWDFWKTESRRAGGLDLARLAHQGRFVFVDGLSGLFLPADVESIAPAAAPASPQAASRGPRTITPRGAPQPARAQVVAPTTPSAPTQQQQSSTLRLNSPTLAHLEETLQRAQAHLDAALPKKTLLILDQPDVLLAAADPAVAPTDLAASLLHLRAGAHSTVLTLSADAPLVAAAAPDVVAPVSRAAHSPLEAAHAAFLIGQAHVADLVLSLRLLDTGYAADVSGVLRITRGDNGDEVQERSGEDDAKAGKELLYYVGGDGTVKVFERGAGTSG
ncbi:uncharacterized protein K452DRAFT_348840 [Aplosporella prunicola CBS 121167]|uniref:Elongator complex protein 6 n=1 Tax=Aplosporella prunicola CBS 121167 TaxID=1176127 RepID=A0A6A6BS23_9PEZI|nr:uncharacterized protein K452DRAFT_348840 [Aplosporella prunicola CBS 121167]KAF2146273.1 hypothetical protein K452DRAFT_348840 [Aplosporella prunicola CBS 121167]